MIANRKWRQGLQSHIRLLGLLHLPLARKGLLRIGDTLLHRSAQHRAMHGRKDQTINGLILRRFPRFFITSNELG
jgi:hypothetical protein